MGGEEDTTRHNPRARSCMAQSSTEDQHLEIMTPSLVRKLEEEDATSHNPSARSCMAQSSTEDQHLENMTPSLEGKLEEFTSDNEAARSSSERPLELEAESSAVECKEVWTTEKTKEWGLTGEIET